MSNNININNSNKEYYNSSIDGEIMQKVSYNDESRWNCTLSQPQSRYTFNVVSGYIAGQPDINKGYTKFPDFEVENNPLNLINKK